VDTLDDTKRDTPPPSSETTEPSKESNEVVEQPVETGTKTTLDEANRKACIPKFHF